MSESNALISRYESVLTESLGYACVPISLGLAFIWRELEVVLVDHGPDDPAYFELYAPVHVQGYAEGELLSAANATNRACKGVSVFSVPDAMIFAVRGVVAAPGVLPDCGHLLAVVPRALSMLGTAIGRFAEELTLAGIAHASTAVEGQ